VAEIVYVSVTRLLNTTSPTALTTDRRELVVKSGGKLALRAETEMGTVNVVQLGPVEFVLALRGTAVVRVQRMKVRIQVNG